MDTKADIDVISANAAEDMMSTHRIISPYSHKVLRLFRETVAASNDPKLIAALNKNLKPSNLRLYYRIKVEDESQANALNNLLSDSNNVVVRYPIDSVHLFPEIFTDEKLNELEDQNTTFYTTVPIQSPLSSSINAHIMDTLYIPDETEAALDFMLNLVTANFSNEFINQLQIEAPSLYDYVMTFHNNNMYIKSENINYSGSDINGNEFNPFGDMNFRPRELYDPVGGGNPYVAVKVPKSKNVTFTDNTLGNNEGVKNLKVVVSRYVLARLNNSTRTDENGVFTSSLQRYGNSIMNLMYTCKDVRLRAVDISSKTIAGTIYDALRGVLTISVQATYIRLLSPFSNVNNYNVNFGHGGKHALWSITYNGIQEANQYTIDLDMRSNAAATKFLDVMCCYFRDADNAGYAAPMLQYIGSVTQGTSWLFNLANISSLAGQSLPGLLPDIWIGGGVLNPRNAADLRSTIYHEYGHSLHYFKANIVNNNHWFKNIEYSLDSAYDTSILGVRGSYFALSEGWAEYIGQLYGSMKYNNQPVLDYSLSLGGGYYIYYKTEPFVYHLENNPTFYNHFIPKGLFYDLTDAGNNEPFDNIQGFTTNDIYQKLNPTMYTIQQFRARWENDHPNANNNALFMRYDVN